MRTTTTQLHTNRTSEHLNEMVTPSLPSKMRAISQTSYGAPTAVLHLTHEAPVPTPKPDEVLLSVRAVSPHKGDSHLIRGSPKFIRLLFSGLFRPTVRTPGTDAAGVVEAVGTNVKHLAVGDRVFGDLSASGFGAFAEYATVNAEHVAKVPEACTFRNAAPLGVSAIAALQAVGNHAMLERDMHVLVTGASGGVGSFAVQIAKARGARVSAMCRRRKMDAVKKLGADEIIDYEAEDVTKREGRFDAVIDAAMYRSPMDYVPVLKEGGRYVAVGGEVAYFLKMMLGTSMWMTNVKKRPASLLDSKPTKHDLETIRELVEEGKLVALIDEEQFGLEDIPRAVEKIENRNVVGKIVVDVVKE